MDGVDANELAERLGTEQQDYWVHVEAGSPLEKYPAKQHARRVAEIGRLTTGLIYLAGQISRNNDDSDMPAPFRQRRYFYYLSGCNEPDCYLTYNIEADSLTLFIPRIDPVRVIWNGRGSTPEEAMDKYDIDDVHFADKLSESITKYKKSGRGNIYVLDGLSPNLPGMDLLSMAVDSNSLRPAMNMARVIKDEHEIGLIRKANEISSRAHREVLATILDSKNEAEVEGLFLNVCVSHQAKEQAYDIIAASGPNAGTLHYAANNEDFDGRQLMCLDAGCEWQLYASDITRTFPLSGDWPSVESKQIYRLVERMQETCIKRLSPGTRYLDLHIMAHQIAIDGLLTLGILHNGTREEIYKAGTSKAFFPHGLGHHVGLEVHDVGQADLMSLTQDSASRAFDTNGLFETSLSLYPQGFHHPVYDSVLCHAPTDPESPQLQEGMVVTVEPGIYFSSYALDKFYLPHPVHSKYINVSVLNKYLPVGGVRIEDDVLITSKGHEVLTTAPKGDDMLKVIQSQDPDGDSAATTSLPKSASMQSEDEPPVLRAPGISRQSTLQFAKACSDPPRTTTPPKQNTERMSTPRIDLGRQTGSSTSTLKAELQDYRLQFMLQELHLQNKISNLQREKEETKCEIERMRNSRTPNDTVQCPRCNSGFSIYDSRFIKPHRDPLQAQEPPPRSSALNEKQKQLMLLNQQHKNRLLIARAQEAERLLWTANQERKAHPPAAGSNTMADYQRKLMDLEQQNIKRMQMARAQEEVRLSSTVEQERKGRPPLPASARKVETHTGSGQSQMTPSEEQHKKDTFLNRTSNSSETPKGPEKSQKSHVLQYYEVSRMLLEAQHKQRLFLDAQNKHHAKMAKSTSPPETLKGPEQPKQAQRLGESNLGTPKSENRTPPTCLPETGTVLPGQGEQNKDQPVAMGKEHNSVDLEPFDGPCLRSIFGQVVDLQHSNVQSPPLPSTPEGRDSPGRTVDLDGGISAPRK